MGIVVGSLVVIIFFILLINFLIKLFTKKEKKSSENNEVIIENEVEVSNEDKNKLIAAITAALTVSAFSGTNARFIVKKIKKI